MRVTKNRHADPPSIRDSFHPRKPNRRPSSRERDADLLDCDRFGQIAGEVDVEALLDREPVGDELQRDDVEQALQAVDGLGDLDALALLVGELVVVDVADDDGAAAAGNDFRLCQYYVHVPKEIGN